MPENATFSYKCDVTTHAYADCALCIFCCTSDISAVLQYHDHVLLNSTDTYNVAFALEVVLSQGKRHEKIQRTGFVHGCIV